MKKLLVFCALLTLTACAVRQPLTPNQIQYRETIKNFPSVFTLPTEQAEQAWGRAQSFIAEYSTMKIQAVSLYVIQTFTPNSKSGWSQYGYSVSRSPMGDKTNFTVQCFCNSYFTSKETAQNASILARYMITGELDPYFIYREIRF